MGQQRAPQGGLTRRRAKGPRGGPLLAAALACVSAGRVAPEVGGSLACHVGGRDWPQGTLSADGAVADARHPDMQPPKGDVAGCVWPMGGCRRRATSMLLATCPPVVGQRADAGSGSGRRAEAPEAGAPQTTELPRTPEAPEAGAPQTTELPRTPEAPEAGAPQTTELPRTP